LSIYTSLFVPVFLVNSHLNQVYFIASVTIKCISATAREAKFVNALLGLLIG